MDAAIHLTIVLMVLGEVKESLQSCSNHWIKLCVTAIPSEL